MKMELQAKRLIEQFRELMAQDNTEKAIKTLQMVAGSFGMHAIEAELAGIASQLYQLDIHATSGTIDPEFAAVQKNRMRRHLLNLADELEAALRNKSFEVELKSAKPLDKKVLDWIGSLFLQPSGK